MIEEILSQYGLPGLILLWLMGKDIIPVLRNNNSGQGGQEKTDAPTTDECAKQMARVRERIDDINKFLMNGFGEKVAEKVVITMNRILPQATNDLYKDIKLLFDEHEKEHSEENNNLEKATAKA